MDCVRLGGWFVMLTAGVVAGAEPAPPEGGREIVVLNRGIGGNSSRDGLARFARDVVAARPEHLVLYFGINDALNSAKLVPLPEYRANLQAMIDQARTAGVRSIVLVTPNPVIASYVKARHPTHPQVDLAAHLATYDAVVRELVRANGLPLADLGSEVRRQGVPLEEERSVIRNQANCRSADGVHLTPAGNRLLASLCAAALGPAVEAGETVLCFGDSITYGAHTLGAGTACGETYPAWLWYLLNRLLGAAQGDRPPAVAPTPPASAQRRAPAAISPEPGARDPR